jgi:hypothetical protein
MTSKHGDYNRMTAEVQAFVGRCRAVAFAMKALKTRRPEVSDTADAIERLADIIIEFMAWTLHELNKP